MSHTTLSDLGARRARQILDEGPQDAVVHADVDKATDLVRVRLGNGRRKFVETCDWVSNSSDLPSKGDKAVVIETADGLIALVRHKPTARVEGASTEQRKRGLARMKRVWRVADSYFDRDNAPLPRVKFGGVEMIFVGWTTNPPGDLASILASGRVEWPDWVNRGFIGENSGDDLDADAARELLIHEWAHAFQRPGLTLVETEGGAQAFTRMFAPEIYDALGITYVNPPMGEDQYTMEDDTTDSGHEFGATGWVLEHRSEQWIIEGQFR